VAAGFHQSALSIMSRRFIKRLFGSLRKVLIDQKHIVVSYEQEFIFWFLEIKLDLVTTNGCRIIHNTRWKIVTGRNKNL